MGDKRPPTVEEPSGEPGADRRSHLTRFCDRGEPRRLYVVSFYEEKPHSAGILELFVSNVLMEALRKADSFSYLEELNEVDIYIAKLGDREELTLKDVLAEYKRAECSSQAMDPGVLTRYPELPALEEKIYYCTECRWLLTERECRDCGETTKDVEAFIEL